jgi:hypothetical protein
MLCLLWLVIMTAHQIRIDIVLRHFKRAAVPFSRCLHGSRSLGRTESAVPHRSRNLSQMFTHLGSQAEELWFLVRISACTHASSKAV